MSNDKNVDILISGIHMKVAGMIAQTSSLSDELVSGLSQAAISLFADKNSGGQHDIDKDILGFFSDSETTLNGMFGQLEAMRDSVFVPYSNAIEEMTKQGSFEEMEGYISEASTLYPDLTPLNEPLSVTDLVAYCCISLSPIANPVKSFKALFEDLYDKMEKNDD